MKCVGSDSMRTRQVLVSTVREIVRSPGVQYLRNKERERMKRREKAKNSHKNKNVNSKNENFHVIDNSDTERGSNEFEDFKLTLSIPFLHSQEKCEDTNGVDSIVSDNNSCNNNRNNYNDNHDGNNDIRNDNDRDKNKINSNNNNGNNSYSSKGTRTSHLERTALHSTLNTISALAPTSDGWTVHGAPKTVPPGPFLPLFCAPEKDTREPSFFAVKKNEIPCSGPGSPIPNRSSGKQKTVHYLLLLLFCLRFETFLFGHYILFFFH